MVNSQEAALDGRLAAAYASRFGLGLAAAALVLGLAEPAAARFLVFSGVLLAVGAQYGLAVLSYSASGLAQAQQRVLLGVAIGLAFLAPLLVPADARLSRLLVAIFGILVSCRMIDLHALVARGRRPAFREYLRIIPNFTILVWRRAPGISPLARSAHLRSVRRGLVSTTIAAGIIVVAAQIEWRGSFLLEHAVKATVFFFGAVAMLGTLVAGIRLAGLPARNFADAPFRSSTPADFWRRYNRFLGQFLHEYVFAPMGGFRSPVTATLAAFLVSGLLHEYIVTISVGRVQGYQLAFFMLHGMAVAATLKLRPSRLVLPLAIALTFSFNLLTSILFFASMHEVVPLYHQPLPAWLW